MLAQQAAESIGRTLHYPVSDSAALSTEIPNSIDRASKFLAFDADGEPIAAAGSVGELPVTPFMETVLDDATAAAARATLGVDQSVAAAGKVQFPATQTPSADPNALDDYEEGTWTPAITFETAGNLSVAYTAQVGHYVKIGRRIFFDFHITTSTFTHTTASGAARITGLPFTSSADAGVTYQAALAWQGISKANYTNIVVLISQNVTYANLQASGSGQNATPIVTGDMPTGGTVVLRASGAYNV
jgi:hypothetical protein